MNGEGSESVIRFPEDAQALCYRCGVGSYIISDFSTGDYVCSGCGLVLDGRITAFSFGHPLPVRQAVYRRVHHFNERLSQWSCVEPSIPEDIMALILAEARKRKYGENYNRRTICKILKAVKVPEELREKYRSQKFKKLPLQNLNRFMERWRKIQWRLLRHKTPFVRRPTVDLVNKMRQDFVALQPAFEKTRHKPGCDKRNQCHKVFGCRHNFLNLNFIMRKLIQRNAGTKVADSWSDVFHQVSPEKCVKLERQFAEMEAYTWPKILTEKQTDGSKVRPLSKSSNSAQNDPGFKPQRKGLELIPLPVVRK